MHEAIWKLLFKSQKSWPETSEDIGLDCNHPATPAPAKKDKKKKGKKAEGGLHPKGTLDAMSGGTEAPSSHEEDEDEDEEEEEEDNPPLKGRKRASEDLEAEASKRGKISLTDGSDSDAEAIPKHSPRVKPLAES
nr:nucleolin-like [Aegilops tauschii subsp. strangulata]